MSEIDVLSVTPAYSWPIPNPDDPDDVPTDLSELAVAIENTVKGGALIPKPAVNGQWLKGVGGLPVWSAITPADISGGGLPGTQLGYAQQITTIAGINGTSFATGSNIATLATPTMDGATPCIFEVYAPTVSLSVAGQIVFALNDGGANGGWIGTYAQQIAGASGAAFHGAIRFTPTAGVHSYAALAWVSGGAATVTCGPGGASQFWPAYVRLTRA